MDNVMLREPEEARSYLLQGLWWQRVVVPGGATIRPVLEWAKEIAAAGQPLPPTGFIGDLGHAVFRPDGEVSDQTGQAVPPGVPINLLRSYEDHVLGKLYADWTFVRAGDALRRLTGRDRGRGLAYFLNQFRTRACFPGVFLSPGILSAALATPPEEILSRGWVELERDGPQPLLLDLYEALVAASRRIGEALGAEDLPELENGTALEDEGPRLARRQVRHAAALLEAALPRRPLPPPSHRADVPTRIFDEDIYPVGGFSSLCTRGSVESLLHSQLAYMEDDQRPDLFDVKFLRDELLYYARDENQLRRRRRTFVLALLPDLVAGRYKDKELPYQRGVMLLALICVLVRKLTEWLATDALRFEIVFIHDGPGTGPLAAERFLLATLFPDLCAAKMLRITETSAKQLPDDCRRWAQRSCCSCLLAGVAPPVLAPERTQLTRLQIDGSHPGLADGTAAPIVFEGEDAVEAWSTALAEVLRRWV